MVKKQNNTCQQFPKFGVYPPPNLICELKLALNYEYNTCIEVTKEVTDVLLCSTPTLSINTRTSFPRTTIVLKKLIQHNGYQVTINGDYDSSFKKVLVLYQKEMGIQIDGIVSSMGSTWEQLLRPQ